MEEKTEIPVQGTENDDVDALRTQNETDNETKNLTSESANLSYHSEDTDISADDTPSPAEPSIEEKYSALNDAYLRKIAEFDNYRKRTVKEKADLIKSGGESVLLALLPVIDDFERALNTLKATDETAAEVEGVKLIYDKFIAFLNQQGVKAITAIGQPFDTESFEAIAMVPGQPEEMKGKIIDCVQTGYTLYDKVIRHAKVVVGD
ncbi:MAG: nucleotide exchange factor GrpE [Tannerella sp.]|jgi:molecular chaperone GrpE|nr:nucleotide exchange factor GrpE [Tannerella sp.]